MHTGFVNLHQFLTMGGYGAYVWPSYALVAVIMIGNVVATRRRRRLFEKKLNVQLESGA